MPTKTESICEVGCIIHIMVLFYKNSLLSFTNNPNTQNISSIWKVSNHFEYLKK